MGNEHFKDEMKEYRDHIDYIDGIMIKLIAERTEAVLDLAAIKKKEGIALIDSKREKEILEIRKRVAKDYDVSEELVEKIFKKILENSHKLLEKIN